MLDKLNPDFFFNKLEFIQLSELIFVLIKNSIMSFCLEYLDVSFITSLIFSLLLYLLLSLKYLMYLGLYLLNTSILDFIYPFEIIRFKIGKDFFLNNILLIWFNLNSFFWRAS